MLTIYPTENYDSYISLADAETLISGNVLDTTAFVVANNPTNSENILSKPFRILVTYEE